MIDECWYAMPVGMECQLAWSKTIQSIYIPICTLVSGIKEMQR